MIAQVLENMNQLANQLVKWNNHIVEVYVAKALEGRGETEQYMLTSHFVNSLMRS